MSDRKGKLQQAVDEAQDIERDPDRVVRTDVKVTRGHGRSKVLQVRLNDDEYNELERLAGTIGDGGVPLSTLARSLLIEGIQRRTDEVDGGSADSAGPAEAAQMLVHLSAQMARIAETLVPDQQQGIASRR
ncbi:hypothetical protein V1Y59_20775 [Gordonia sp. PKS22-38]|uniref:Ribbon-helix-helix protein, copG family n=1 Tax=Gordonia prachuapensis TaxID=3115651 RepID=A0ABU7N012_9ACTN|nr:hypothetical protein [Gordonia sp. PKS22-38]